MDQNIIAHIFWFHEAFGRLRNLPANAKISIESMVPWDMKLISFRAALSSLNNHDEEYLTLKDYYDVCNDFFNRGLELSGFFTKYYTINNYVLQSSISKIVVLFEKLFPLMG